MGGKIDKLLVHLSTVPQMAMSNNKYTGVRRSLILPLGFSKLFDADKGPVKEADSGEKTNKNKSLLIQRSWSITCLNPNNGSNSAIILLCRLKCIVFN